MRCAHHLGGLCQINENGVYGQTFHNLNNVKTMKMTQNAEISPIPEDDLLPEYEFDYSQGHPNRFVEPINDTSKSVITKCINASIAINHESQNLWD